MPEERRAEPHQRAIIGQDRPLGFKPMRHQTGANTSAGCETNSPTAAGSSAWPTAWARRDDPARPDRDRANAGRDTDSGARRPGETGTGWCR
jgi:hypothetical protein